MLAVLGLTTAHRVLAVLNLDRNCVNALLTAAMYITLKDLPIYN